LYLDPPLLILRSIVKDSLLLLVVLLKLLVLGSKILIDINKVINLLIQDIHISEQVIVLFLTFDEGVLDFKDVGKARCLFNSGECFVDNFHIPLIVINKFDFFLVVNDQLS
jgi:hypothetical protein